MADGSLFYRLAAIAGQQPTASHSTISSGLKGAPSGPEIHQGRP